MQGIFHHRYKDSIALVADATPAAQKLYGPCPMGYEWYIEVVSFAVVGNTHTAIFDLAVTPDGGTLPAEATWDHAGLLWSNVTAAVKGSENTGPPFFVDEGEFVHILVAGGTLAQGDGITVNFQIRVDEKSPIYGLMTPEERAELAAAHEREGFGQVTLPATASERAV